jgi:hypothetical protein
MEHMLVDVNDPSRSFGRKLALRLAGAVRADQPADAPSRRGSSRDRQANARVIQVERTDAGVMKRMERRVLD